jgi:hypothetical protein
MAAAEMLVRRTLHVARSMSINPLALLPVPVTVPLDQRRKEHTMSNTNLLLSHISAISMLYFQCLGPIYIYIQILPLPHCFLLFAL